MKTIGILLTTASLLAFSGCAKQDLSKVHKIDPTLDLNREDYRHMTDAKRDGNEPPEPLNVTIDKSAPPVPQLAEILAAPRPPKIGETQLVSIAVTDDVPLKDVLLELAKLADVDIELDAGITGGISFIAKEKPFNEVVDRIANLAGLRYTMKNGVLRMERDTPYIKSYTVDFLNQDRDSDNSSNVDTGILSSGSSGSGGGSGGGSSGGSSGGGSTGSTSKTSTKTKGDFWASLQLGLDQIIAYQPARFTSTTTQRAESDTTMLTKAEAPAAAGAAGAPAAGATPAAPPAAAPVPAAVTASSSTGSASSAAKNYTINRQAGIITFNGNTQQQEMVETLLGKLKTNSSAQVLIEAKIIEVDLDEQYKTGINWSILSKKVSSGVTFNDVGNALSTSSPTADIATISLASGDVSAIVSLMESFGTTRTLSSPRLHAINNQTSTLNFTLNKVYYSVTATQTPTTTTGTTTTAPTVTVTSTRNTVPIGIIMSIMPSIDMENNEVTMSVHPALSTLSGNGVEDPAVKYLAAQVGDPTITSLTPEVQTRELDSTVRMKSGQTMVIGGLMQQTGENTDAGVPFIDTIPVVGNLFKSVARHSTNKELVLLIKATIVDTNGTVSKPDREIFRKFSDDPRPVSF